MVFDSFRRSESRKFIDLLLKSNNKWANIEPTKRINVGDFGYIERSTGDFVVEGNLYQHPDTQVAMESCPEEVMAPTRFEKYTSLGIKEIAFTPNVSAGFTSIIDVSLEGTWTIGNKRSAMLLLLSPQLRTMTGFPSKALLEKRPRYILKNKVICTEVHTSPAFVLYLSNSQKHNFGISLNANVPLPVAPGVSVGGGIGVSWNYTGTQGVVKDGADPNGQHVYFPLYGLKQIHWGKVSSFRGEIPEVSDMSSIFEDVNKPWEDLDSDGESIDFPIDNDEPLEGFQES